MIPEELNDKALHENLKSHVKNERLLLTKILDLLKEVEKRKLFCDFQRSSLFDYAVYDLGYSEDQAHRRIQAMRLMTDVPQVREKLASGSLTLTNASKVQSVFRKTKKENPDSALDRSAKLSVLDKIEGKSTRAAERELLDLFPENAAPKEYTRPCGDKIEIKVVISQETNEKLEAIRALLGSQGASLSQSDLIEVMADLANEKLAEQRFGKKRVDTAKKPPETVENTLGSPKVEAPKSTNNRYISKAVRHQVWTRDKGCCTNCGSSRSVQFDHRIPFALGDLLGEV